MIYIAVSSKIHSLLKRKYRIPGKIAQQTNTNRQVILEGLRNFPGCQFYTLQREDFGAAWDGITELRL